MQQCVRLDQKKNRFKMATETQFRLTKISLVFILLVSVTMAGLSDTTEQPSTFRSEYLRPPQSVKLAKFSLTQKGYIQFLRYITEVPPIGDFTFCIWMKSANLTYSHPLLSYSRHESERLIRAWVTPGGDEIRLTVKEVDIIRVSVALKENQWYHICQSWSTKTGHWDLFLNGKLKSHGNNNKARGQILPKEGDIVVGQEYTDFDKGLDDGIEGDIFGFNMVLASTSAPQKGQRREKEPLFNVHRRISTPEKIKGHYIVEGGPLYIRRAPKSVELEEDNLFVNNNNNTSTSTEEENTSDSDENLNDSDSRREKRQSYNMYPMSFVRYVLMPQQKLSKPIYPYLYPSNQYAYRYTLPQIQKTMLPPMPTFRSKISRIANDIPVYTSKPLGLQLVELSYDCAKGKGAPLTGKDVLISWRKTPVRVFGGAILKKVDPFCY